MLATTNAQIAPTAIPAANSVAGPSTGATQAPDNSLATGSYLPMSADAPAVPVTTIDAKAIEDSGESDNLMEVLAKVAPQFSGGLNLGPTNGNIASNSTNGGSQVALRNLPTLVLIDGHRAAFAPVDAVGGFEFADLNLIPVSAVEKVEIMTEGASAIYGAGAVGGVVNIILKSDYNGWAMDSRYEWATSLQAGHWSSRTVDITGGVSNGTTSILIGAAWTKQDPLYQYQVSTSKFTSGTTNYPGVVNVGGAYYLLNPSLTTPPVNASLQTPEQLVAAGVYSGPYSSQYIVDHYNLSTAPTSFIGDQRKSLVVNFDHKLTDTVKFVGTVMYSQTDTFSELTAQPVSETIEPGAPNDPFSVAVKAHDRFVDHPREDLIDTTNLLAIAGFEGNVGSDYTWNTSADYNTQSQHFVNQNLVDVRQLIAAEESSSLNLFAYQQAPGAIANSGIFGSALGEFQTSLLTYDALLTGKPFTLPGGDFEFAVGAQYRREGLSANADINSLPATFDWASGTTISPLTTSRSIWAEFAQVNIPLVSPSQKIPGIYSLSTSDAIRHEAYEGINDKPTDPLFSVRYQPFDDELTLRGTWTKAFIAPTLYELYGPVTYGPLISLAPFETPYGPFDSQPPYVTGSNPLLKPSFSESATVGFVYAPRVVKGLSVAVDYHRIRLTNIVSTADELVALEDVDLHGPASAYAKLVGIGNFPGRPGSTPITAPGQIGLDPANIYFLGTFANLDGIKYEGVDMAVNYTVEIPGIGHFDLSNKTTFNLKYWALSPDAPAEETAGYASYYNGTIPRFRSYTTLDYQRGGWGVFLAQTWIPALTDNDDGEHVDPYYSYDVVVSYTFSSSDPSFLSSLKGLKLSLGVTDLLNRQPSNDYDVFSTDNADISTYSPLGRTVYASAAYKF